MFESLTEKLERAFKLLKGEGYITEVNISETLKEVRRALVDADVNYKIAKEFTDRVKAKALGQNVINAIRPGQLFIKIVRDELVELLGSKESELKLNQDFFIVMLIGLQGSGKTTFAAKLANYVKTKHGKQPILVACDIRRPAAIDQLKILGDQVQVPVYFDYNQKDVCVIAENAIKEAKLRGYNVVIIDTAGRTTVDKEMMNEITLLHKKVNPNEVLFVIDSMMGQDAVNTAKAFNEALEIDGVVLTKLDGDTRGGAALSVKSIINKPIKFISTGEKLDAIDLFYPSRMADRILGMGDIVSFVEKAQQLYTAEQEKKLTKKILQKKFDLEDYLEQIRIVKKAGNLKEMLSLVPGLGGYIKNINIDESIFKKSEAIILSMTPKERKNPDIINLSRKKRIAKGSGTTVQDVNNVLKHFYTLKKLTNKFVSIEMNKKLKKK